MHYLSRIHALIDTFFEKLVDKRPASKGEFLTITRAGKIQKLLLDGSHLSSRYKGKFQIEITYDIIFI